MVPHTPVLEGKQLPMASQSQTIPCTPSEPPANTVPQLAVSAVSMQATGGEKSYTMHYKVVSKISVGGVSLQTVEWRSIALLLSKSLLCA